MLAVAKGGMDMDGCGVLLQFSGSPPRKAKQKQEEERKDRTGLKRAAHQAEECLLLRKMLLVSPVFNRGTFQRFNG
jgi:hypothetical protein